MKISNFIFTLIIPIAFFSCENSPSAPLEVSPLFTNNMVLQQQDNVAFWGQYTPDKEINISGSWGNEASTKVDDEGNWEVKLKTPEAGGPYTVEIKAKDTTIVINDVLIGEVWLASGQSNMEMPLKGFSSEPIDNHVEEIKNANYKQIRMLTVKRNLAISTLDTISGKWLKTTPENVTDFSATAYFFARKLHKELQVPIGIIHSSWGGTPAESWTSKQSLKKLEDFDKAIEMLDDPNAQTATTEWFKNSESVEVPKNKEQWQKLNFNDEHFATANIDSTNWKDISIPGRFDQLNGSSFDGAMWLRKDFNINNPKGDYTLNIDAIDDMDAVYINGEKVGGLMGYGFWQTFREYKIPNGLIKEGKNNIAVRAIDTGGPGTVSGPIEIRSTNSQVISLNGIWKSRLVAEIYDGKFKVYALDKDLTKRPNLYQISPGLPSVLYNAMIHPLVPYTIKGAIWYQGESNVGRHEQYRKLFPAMIEDWRAKWNQEFPFYFVQIAPFNYNGSKASPALRDAQRYSLKTLNTGMAITMDIGHPTSIHPGNKQDVGGRLARLALANNYNKDIVASGPLFQSLQQNSDKLILEFDYTGSGLIYKGDKLTGFEIAGEDKVYQPAKAKIVDNTVEVSSSTIANPKFVRYGWLDYFEATLFNKEGIPASSFTSEQ